MTEPTPTQPPKLMSEAEARMRAELYLENRLNHQAQYYQRRIEEFNFNADRMLRISAFLMGLSTVLSSLAIPANSRGLAFVTALLPAFAGLVSSFRSLYQWERQSSIYEEAQLALQQAKLALPDENYIKARQYSQYFPELVRQTEEVLRAEASQWGQLEKLLPSATLPQQSGSSQTNQPLDDHSQ